MSLTEEKQNEEFQALFLIIENLLSQIYQYINTQRYQSELLSNIDIWNQICSSLWVLEDSLFSINDYVKSEFPDSDGLKYIFLYGILQALFIQQDAVAHLAEAFEIDIGGRSESLTQIREIRNAAIGHPTKRNHRKKKYFNYISRISMSKYFFTLQVASKDTPDDFKNINIEELINSQLTEIKELLIMINDELSNRDKTHKMEFKDELLLYNKRFETDSPIVMKNAYSLRSAFFTPITARRSSGCYDRSHPITRNRDGRYFDDHDCRA
jgi:hypothetical protein